jgi:imidazole glycerol-phosphate synthase subunit HisH
VPARTVLVLDHAIARTRRLMLALSAVGVDARLTDTPLSARQADILIVPDGDDHDDALARGISSGVIDAIAAHVERERPLLAIGLGLCFLLEGRTHPAMPPGASIFRAPVQRFDPRMAADDGERPLLSPHLGSSFVVGLDRQPILKSVVPKDAVGAWFAFRHRLCAPSRIPQADVAIAHHGVPFAAAIWRGQTLACHFLPEQSGVIGLDVLRAFFAATSTTSTTPTTTTSPTPRGTP